MTMNEAWYRLYSDLACSMGMRDILFLLGCAPLRQDVIERMVRQYAPYVYKKNGLLCLSGWGEGQTCVDAYEAIIGVDHYEKVVMMFQEYSGIKFLSYTVVDHDFTTNLLLTWKHTIEDEHGYGAQAIPLLNGVDATTEAQVALFFLTGYSTLKDRTINHILAGNQGLFKGYKTHVLSDHYADKIDRLVEDFDAENELLVQELKQYIRQIREN